MASIGDEHVHSPEKDHETSDEVQPVITKSSSNNNLSIKRSSRNRLVRRDSLDLESAEVNHSAYQDVPWLTILQFAFQSLGVVYGDLGTSPLYVFGTTFANGVNHNDDILAVLALVLYTITLLPIIKYACIVLRANDNGDGGTFALYSLLCRNVKAGLIPNQEAEDRDVSNYRLEGSGNNRAQRATKLKSVLENSSVAKYVLLFATMLGTAMVIGDGILTPSISVLSAVVGIKEATPKMTNEAIVWISVVILILLFAIQRYGTDTVGYTFAPVMLLWFAMIAVIGSYNIIVWQPSVFKALYPLYIVQYFQRNGRAAWISLGGVVLSITGTEAMFADLGYFNVKSIQISLCSVVYPSLVLAYTGQASYLRIHPIHATDPFYKSIPELVYWPMFVVAVLAAIIASQAMISGSFAIIQQSLALGCFPRVKVVHTSAKYRGQVYVPEVNYILMLASVLITVGFKSTANIGNAFGIAVVFVMVLTSAFLVLIMVMVWKTHIALILLYVITVGFVEVVYLSSVLFKFTQGGYLPLAISAFLMAIMYTWNYTYRKMYHYDRKNMIPSENVEDIVAQSSSQRMPGLAIFYSELVHGVPPIFKHYLNNVPAIHSVLVFVSIKSLPITKVPAEERFLFRRVRPDDLNIYRCVVRYGYNDVRNEEEPFEQLLLAKLKDYINEDNHLITLRENHDGRDDDDKESKAARDVAVLEEAYNGGVVHLIGENDVVAGKGANIAQKILIDYAYCFLKRNLRQSNEVLHIPHEKLLKVGMVYQLIDG